MLMLTMADEKPTDFKVGAGGNCCQIDYYLVLCFFVRLMVPDYEHALLNWKEK